MHGLCIIKIEMGKVDSLTKAKVIQKEPAAKVLTPPFAGDVSRVAGVDAAFIDNRIIGAVLRTRDNIKPMFISPGHLIDIEGAVRFVLASLKGYRMPEPTRLAHIACASAKRGLSEY